MVEPQHHSFWLAEDCFRDSGSEFCRQTKAMMRRIAMEGVRNYRIIICQQTLFLLLSPYSSNVITMSQDNLVKLACAGQTKTPAKGGKKSTDKAVVGCGTVNYITRKNKKNPTKLLLRKFCNTCRQETWHTERKK